MKIEKYFNFNVDYGDSNSFGGKFTVNDENELSEKVFNYTIKNEDWNF